MADAALGGSLAILLVIVTAADLRTRIVPDRALAPAVVLAVVVIGLDQPSALPGRLAWAAAAGGFLLAAALVRPEGMGLGDVKLAAVLGLYLGGGVAPALLIAFTAGALWGLGVIAVHGWSARHAAIPFAPFLATGAAVAWVATATVAGWN